MPDGREPVTIQVASRIAELPAAQWDACAGKHNPFVSHAFLSALEDSGSATAEVGWLPQHLAITDQHGRLIGCAPLYLKSHSYGEYVFDWGWAEAYERAGGRYYPKLQSSVPFTPVTGPRLLVRPGAVREAVAGALIAGMVELAERHAVSSLHVTFPEKPEWQALGAAGFLRRSGLQYHWLNRGYESFEAFLATLTSRKRKAIRKERRKVLERGVVLSRLSGAAIESRHWDAFYRFYLATADRKWGQPYLNREFFARLGDSLAERIVLVLAAQDGTPVAGALNLLGGSALYGRNWGSIGHYRFLHFEACYYQAIEHAIAHGLGSVEAGAQGEHKIQRGYLPVETYSAHWIRDARFRDAVAQFLERERVMLGHEKVALEELNPFRNEGS
jgi:predicted N-acyltransferase